MTTEHGIEITPVFGGTIISQDGVGIEVVERPGYRTSYYIAIGQAGFNSITNNGMGYKSAKLAASASLRYRNR